MREVGSTSVCEFETEGDTGTDRKAILQRNVIERLCLCKRDGVEEREREELQHLWYAVNL